MRRLGDEVIRLARSRLSFVVLGAVAVVPSATYVLAMGAMARLPALGPFDVTAFDLDPSQAYEAILTLHLIFAVVCVGAYAGVIGAISERDVRPRWSAPDAAGLRRVRVFIAISAVLLPGLMVASACGAGTALALATATGWSAWDGMSVETLGELAGLVVRGWLALLPFAAVAFLVGAATRRRLGGLVAVAAVVLLEQLASTALSPDYRWWSPFANAAALVGSSTLAEVAEAVLVVGAYVAGSLAIAATLGTEPRVQKPARGER